MPSDVDIVNRALRNIGGTRITSLTDGSTNANIANDIYDMVRDDLLRSHNWKFATKLVKLSRLATAPTFEYDYGYALPNDWLRTITVHDNDAGTSSVPFREAEIDGVGAILTSAEDIYLRYVYSVEDINRATPDFHTALSLAMSAEMAIPVANSNRLHETYLEVSRRALVRAKSSDSLGSPADARPAGSWATSRGSWPSTRWPR